VVQVGSLANQSDKACASTSVDSNRKAGSSIGETAIDPVWEARFEVLHFQLGPLKLGEVSLKALTLVSNPFLVHTEWLIPMAQATAQGCRAVVISAMPVGKRFAPMWFDRGALRYAARYGDRYVVDLQGSFAEYTKKFSKKSRGNLQRCARRFSGGDKAVGPIQEFRNPSEMIAFRDIAVAISRASYKSELGWGFQEDECFARQIKLDAAAERVRGYVLMFDGQPAAYAFCRIDHDVIVYKHIGYDEQFAQSSPGTALLYLMLQRLFDEGEFRLLDFDGTEFYAYKEFFATRAISCARVFWFPPRLPAVALFGTHWILTATWRVASLLRHHIRRVRRGWVSARTQLRRSRQ